MSFTPRPVRTNQWGSPLWEVNTDLNADAKLSNSPSSAARLALGNLGVDKSYTNPWVRYLSEQAAPTLSWFYEFQRPQEAGAGGADGFAKWMQDRLGSAIQPGGAAGLPRYGDFMSMMQGIANGQAPDSIMTALATDNPSDQIEMLQSLLQGMGSMSMTGLAARGMQNSLQAQLREYWDMMNSGDPNGVGTASPIDFLARSGWWQKWFGGGYNGMAPASRGSGLNTRPLPQDGYATTQPVYTTAPAGGEARIS